MRLSHPFRSLLALGAAFTMSLAACSGNGGGADSTTSNDEHAQSELTLERANDVAEMVPRDIAARDAIQVGVTVFSPPSAYYDNLNGKLVGLDVEVADALRQVMGLANIEFVPVPFPQLLDGLGEDYDIALSLISVTPDRLESHNFITYAETGSVFMTKVDNPHSFDPEGPCGDSVLVEAGTVQQVQVELLSAQCVASEREPIEVLAEETIDQEVMELRVDAAPAAYLDSAVAQFWTSTDRSRLEQAGNVQNRDPIAVAVAKTNPQLTVTVQAAMQLLIDEGHIATILQKYGVDDGALSASSINPRTEW